MYAKHIKPDSKVSLKDIDANDNGGLEKADGLLRLDELGAELAELQELLAAAGKTGLLVVFQGMDTAGKDGAINRLLGYMNVQSCRVSSFKVPTEKERSHDFLWRVHSETPGRGAIGIFNRSHYEDVLVVRVHDLAPKEVWKRRYDHINAFESGIADSDILVVKFFLHITKDEQEQRLLDREKEVEKAWKLSAGDWKEREFWDDYQAAYEDVLEKCSTERAPWYVVPAGRKWFRDLCVAEVLVHTLKDFAEPWRDHLKEIGDKAKVELAEFRKSGSEKV